MAICFCFFLLKLFYDFAFVFREEKIRFDFLWDLKWAHFSFENKQRNIKGSFIFMFININFGGC